MAITAPLLWLDGKMSSSGDAGAPLMGHAVQRGSLVFDVGSFHPTPNGTALFRAREHVERFVRSSRIVGLELPFAVDALVDAALRVVRESGFSADAEGMIRWSAFYAASEPDLVPRDTGVRVAVAAQALQDPPRDRASWAIKVSIFDDARKAPPDVLPPDTKAAGAYLGPMIAKRRAIAAGTDDVVLLDCDGDIAEAPIANAFAVVNGTLWTPPLGRILPGITRDAVLTLARALSIPTKEARLPLGDFLAADEAFLTSTSLPVAPIGFVNGKPIGRDDGKPGPITVKITNQLLKAQHGACKEHTPWLTFVR
jgi:branched-chain amino acid aminotransferase